MGAKLTSDKYMSEYLEAIKKAKTDEEKMDLLNKIYEDGFTDGRENA